MKFPAYPKTKPSGVEWLGDVPEHWEVKRLKWSVISCKNGAWGDEPADEDDGITCIRVADFDRQRFRVVDQPPTKRKLDFSLVRRIALSRGDLLIEKSGGGEKQLVGCVVIFDHGFPAVSSNFIARMRVAPRIEGRFLTYLHAGVYAGRLNYPAIKQTTGIQNLDSDAYLDLKVAFPPQSDQQTIADFLDERTGKLDALAEKKRGLIEKLKEKRSALISRTVTRGLPPKVAAKAGLPANPKLRSSGIAWLGDIPEHWKTTRLKYLVSRVVDCPHETPNYSTDGEFVVIRTSDLSLGRLDLLDARRVEEDEYLKRIRREVLIEGDIVYSREGERWGFGALVPSAPLACLGQRMMQFRPENDVNSSLLMWALNSRSVYQQGAVDVLGSTAPHVNVGTIRNYWLAAPPASEQTAIADYLDRETATIDRMIEKVEAALEKLSEYRTALITAAVTGKIDVRRVGKSRSAKNG